MMPSPSGGSIPSGYFCTFYCCYLQEPEIVSQSVDSNGINTARVRYKVAQGTPTTITAPLSVDGGTASASSVSVPGGRVYSDEIMITQEVSGQAVTLAAGDVVVTKTGPNAAFTGMQFAAESRTLFGTE